MKTFTLLVFLGMISGVAQADESAKAPSADFAPENSPKSDDETYYDGVWKPKGAMLNGVLLPPPALKAITLKIDGNTYEVTIDGEDHPDQGTFEIDASTTPKRMTIKSLIGPNKGKTIYAIYEIKNANAMRVCYDLAGKAFPDAFKAPKGSQRYLAGYRRQVSDPADQTNKSTTAPNTLSD